MNTCLQNIVSVKNPCLTENPISLSGYDLLDAPEISKSNISQIANSDELNGYLFLKKQLEYAIRDVNNDFLALLNTNNLIVQTGVSSISTGEFSNAYTNPANQKRGISIFRNSNRKPNSIKKLVLKDVLIYPISDHEQTTLYVLDGSEVIEYKIKLFGERINRFTIDYTAKNSDNLHIYLDNVETYSSQLTCLLGCGGTILNECGYVKGYNNGMSVQREGYGINAVFGCECDYESLLCRFSKTYVGEIIYLKARSNILKERLYNERLTPYIIYGRDEAEKLQVEIENEYREKWNAFISSIPDLLANDSDCINCKKVRIVVNV